MTGAVFFRLCQSSIKEFAIKSLIAVTSQPRPFISIFPGHLLPAAIALLPPFVNLFGPYLELITPGSCCPVFQLAALFAYRSWTLLANGPR